MAPIEFVRTGIILCVVNYESCVRFYREVFGLPLLHEKQSGDFRLTCLDFGASYLMIETGGTFSSESKSLAENPTKLRFNVRDLDQARFRLNAMGIDAAIETFDWGSAINIVDPDGNHVGIRDEERFEPE